MTVIWNPVRTKITEDELLYQVERLTYSGLQPLSNDGVVLLSAISKAILTSPLGRTTPQYVALGFWLRPASLRRMIADIKNEEAGTKNSILTPRGVALHLPPTNVDTIFVYSWALSVLAGNANIVRIASELSANTEWLVELISGVVAQSNEKGRQIFCSYSYGGEFEKRLSALFDLRMIWGGDTKINAVSRISIRPDGLSIGFPDRKSMALVSAVEYAAASAKTRDLLAVNLYNDIYWFDQMGCGSPRMIIWVGDETGNSKDLHERLLSVIESKHQVTETGVAISKMAFSNNLLAECIATSARHYNNMLDVAKIADPVSALEFSQGGGYLMEAHVKSIEDVAAFMSRKIQTLTHFGFSRCELDRLACKMSGRGGYRLVPVGQALQFENIWDGVELFSHMTRRLVIRTD